MKLTLALLIATAVAYVFIRNVASAKSYGVDVADRFIERLAYIPSKTQSLLTRDNLAKWLADPDNAGAAAGYAAPVLFPLDLLFLILLGFLLGIASIALVGELMAGIFKSVVPLTDTSFQVLHALTMTKIASLTAAFGQVGFLGVLCVLLRLFPASPA